MQRLLYIILYVVLAASASAQVKAAIKREQNQTRLGSAEREQARTEFKVTGRVIDLQNRQSSESHTSLLVYGRVVTEEGKANKPVSDVIVKMVSGTKTLAFTSTNAKGEYALELKSATSGEVSLQFTHISYEKESERLTLK